MKQFSLFLLTILVQCIFNSSYAQNVKVPEKDIIEVIFGTNKNNKKPENDSLIPRKFYTSILPIPGYNPALGFVIGAGISTNFLSGSANKTHLSNILANATITTRNQFNLYARNMIFLKDDEWVLQGDWRWLIFSQPTYGLGINFNDLPNTTAKEEPMKFNYLRFYQTLYKKLWGTWYAGIGVNIDRHYSVVDQLLDTTSANQYLTAHYDYSKLNNIRQDQYASVGISLNLLYDTRDNSVNPKRGQYAKMTFRINNEIFGSTRSHNTLYYEYRTYWNPTKMRVRPHIIGFWTMGSLLMSGKQPYLEMPAIGWDMYNRTGRGYIQGRIRGENMWYGETEYRFPISKNGLLGGVGFFNLTTATDEAKKQKLGNEFAAGFGFGLRIKMSKKTNTNIAIDYGMGRNGSSGVFVNLLETF
ncbi:BamA/TamA family outer membrane protein [Sediminibacterium sp.]|uniref:BamA/TamA family outer membrane protein n=1 Tax=Sediminibacterium sp. TaxID=1917865 RepID=UPI003F724DDB